MLNILVPLAVIASVAFSPTRSNASDHIDGPVTTGHRVADLSDYYVFPTPGKAGHLTLILNTYPVVPSNGHFTDKVNYAFLIRKAAIAGTGASAAFTTSNEVVINCKFITPREHHNHPVNCTTTNGLAASAVFNKSGSTGDFSLYAGMRSDPFFFYAQFAQALATEGVMKPAKDDNTMSRINVLSIAIEIQLSKLFPNQTVDLLAAATAVVTKDSPTSALRFLDRIGRPEVTNVSLFTPNGERELRDLYNAERPFNVNANAREEFKARLSRNIDHYDRIDQVTNWNAAQKSAFVNVFTDDFLVVDVTKPCNSDSFLEIEKAIIKGQAHQSCGGRKLTDDIMDTLFTIYIKGLDGARVRDGVNAPHKAPTATFPHLREPSLGLLDKAKQEIARRVLGID
jgi:hypothetical protein